MKKNVWKCQVRYAKYAFDAICMAKTKRQAQQLFVNQLYKISKKVSRIETRYPLYYPRTDNNSSDEEEDNVPQGTYPFRVLKKLELAILFGKKITNLSSSSVETVFCKHAKTIGPYILQVSWDNISNWGDQNDIHHTMYQRVDEWYNIQASINDDYDNDNNSGEYFVTSVIYPKTYLDCKWMCGAWFGLWIYAQNKKECLEAFQKRLLTVFLKTKELDMEEAIACTGLVYKSAYIHPQGCHVVSFP